MLIGAFFGIWAADWTGSWVVGLLFAMLTGGLLALIHAFFAIHLRADQIVGGTAINFLALGITGYVFITIYGNNGTPANISNIPDVTISTSGNFFARAFGSLNLMIWLSILLVILTWWSSSGPRSACASARSASTRARPTRSGISVYGIRYAARHALRRARRARRRVPLDRLRPLVQPEHDRRAAASSRSPRSSSGNGGRSARSPPRSCSGSRAPSPTGCPTPTRTASGDPVPDAAVRPHPDRGRRSHRPLDPARRRWSPVRKQ